MFNDRDMVPLAVGDKPIEDGGGELGTDIEKLSSVSKERILSLK